jgi:hypothetical protein
MNWSGAALARAGRTSPYYPGAGLAEACTKQAGSRE